MALPTNIILGFEGLARDKQSGLLQTKSQYFKVLVIITNNEAKKAKVSGKPFRSSRAGSWPYLQMSDLAVKACHGHSSLHF